MMQCEPSASAGKQTGRVLLFADVRGAQPGGPSAVLSDPRQVNAALMAVRKEPRFAAFGDTWIDLKKLRHTRSGSSGLLSFALSGGRIATVQVPAEVLREIRATRH